MTARANRILTTHIGVLSRPAELNETLLGRERVAAAGMLKSTVADVVREQVRTGLDIINDGEFGKSIWMWYATDRLTGFERRPYASPLLVGRDREQFREFYAYAERTPGTLFQEMDKVTIDALATQPVCVGPITYKPDDIRRDLANLKAALQGVDVLDAFVACVAPASIEVGLKNEFYKTDDELLWALADAMKDEYQAVVDAGFQVQVDDAWIPALWDRESYLDMATYRKFCAGRIEALNHALAGLPEDRVRYHLCWGSWHGPHATDIPLAEIVDLMLQVRAGVYLVEAANVRHEHEYHLWETLKLPDGKILAPGVVTHSTNLIEHPELVAERIVNFAERVGRENVIAGADCGMGGRIHRELGWAKLGALVEGARLATAKLWR